MKNIFLIVVLLFSGSLWSCEEDKLDIQSFGKINGSILDGESYQPVSGALITTTPASLALLSDEEGQFMIDKIITGEVAINVKKKDYLSNTFTIAVYDEEDTQVELLIYKDENDVGNVNIYDPVPGNGAVDQPLSITLKWKIEGKKANAELSYTVYIFESNSTVQKLLGEDLILQEVTTSGLKYSTTYFWYVVAKYDGNKIAFSPTWSFQTEPKE